VSSVFIVHVSRRTPYENEGRDVRGDRTLPDCKGRIVRWRTENENLPDREKRCGDGKRRCGVGNVFMRPSVKATYRR